jgi:hypothetical protein
MEFDELGVVDLDEGLIGDVVFAQIESLLEAKFLVECDGVGEIVHAKGDVGDSVEGCRFGVGLRVDEGYEKDWDKCAQDQSHRVTGRAVAAPVLPDHRAFLLERLTWILAVKCG